MHRAPASIRGLTTFAAGRLWLAALLLVVLAGCAGERVISAEELMPPGAKEVMPPRDFVDTILGKRYFGQMWLRGCQAEGGWKAVVAHTEEETASHSYYQVTYKFKSVDDVTTKLGITSDDFYRLYKSPGNTIVVGIINLKVARDKGVPMDGLADFILFGGTDVSHYDPHP